jgi:hypothetical protein
VKKNSTPGGEIDGEFGVSWLRHECAAKRLDPEHLALKMKEEQGVSLKIPVDKSSTQSIVDHKSSYLARLAWKSFEPNGEPELVSLKRGRTNPLGSVDSVLSVTGPWS